MSRSRHPLPGSAVLLRHDLPDGSHHYDWMIQREGPAAPLVTFRVTLRIDRLDGDAAFDAHRLPDHRPAYLDHEGPVSGDRGTVTRVARGELAIRQDSPTGFAAVGRIGASEGEFLGAPDAPGRWAFHFRPAAPRPDPARA